MSVRIGIRSHKDLIMPILKFCNYFQITHRKARIKSDIWFLLPYLVIKSIKDNVLSTLLNHCVVSVFSNRVVNEGTAFDVFYRLYLQL